MSGEEQRQSTSSPSGSMRLPSSSAPFVTAHPDDDIFAPDPNTSQGQRNNQPYVLSVPPGRRRDTDLNMPYGPTSTPSAQFGWPPRHEDVQGSSPRAYTTWRERERSPGARERTWRDGGLQGSPPRVRSTTSSTEVEAGSTPSPGRMPRETRSLTTAPTPTIPYRVVPPTPSPPPPRTDSWPLRERPEAAVARLGAAPSTNEPPAFRVEYYSNPSVAARSQYAHGEGTEPAQLSAPPVHRRKPKY
jgi:hypothetical protein